MLDIWIFGILVYLVYFVYWVYEQGQLMLGRRTGREVDGDQQHIQASKIPGHGNSLS